MGVSGSKISPVEHLAVLSMRAIPSSGDLLLDSSQSENLDTLPKPNQDAVRRYWRALFLLEATEDDYLNTLSAVPPVPSADLLPTPSNSSAEAASLPEQSAPESSSPTADLSLQYSSAGALSWKLLVETRQNFPENLRHLIVKVGYTMCPVSDAPRTNDAMCRVLKCCEDLLLLLGIRTMSMKVETGQQRKRLAGGIFHAVPRLLVLRSTRSLVFVRCSYAKISL